MSEYLPSFIVEPVLRQARRFSRLSGTTEESPGFFPAVPDLQRWSPSRLWNTSPPPSLEDPAVEPESEHRETTVQSIARTIQLWANQLNSFDSIPSPPLESQDDSRRPSSEPSLRQEPSITEFPPLEPEPSQPPRPAVLQNLRTESETSLNPANELSYRSRVHEDSARPHAASDPLRDLSRVATLAGTPDVQEISGGRGRDGSGTLPEDDGMGTLRHRINAVWAGPGTAAEKSRLVHALMMERYQKGLAGNAMLSRPPDPSQRPASPSSTVSGAAQEINYNVTAEALVPTYAPLDPDDIESSGEISQPMLGCVHYKRNVKMQCSVCERWYTCRLCHDEAENHILPRQETKHMLCMLCNTPQAVGQFCKACQVQTACYYCPICILWNNDPERSIYHCDDCGICRLGEGLGKDFFHCKTCAACMSIQAESTHKCIEKSTKCDCPICGDYKCPICSKSIANMESQFRRLDRHIEEQPMPEEYRGNRAYIFCNDCNSRSVTKYHWLGLKCTICESYNTTQLELLGAEETPQLQEQQERAQQAGTSEAALTASQSHTPTERASQPVDIAGASDQVVPHPIDIGTTSTTPRSRSSWLLPHSPTARSARSVSPVVGSYFGTGQRAAGTPEAPRRGTILVNDDDDDDDLDFWGRPNSPGHHNAAEAGSESESESERDEPMEDEDGEEEEDAMDLIGHR
ncbi:uncharacterized protein Z520_08936 [Fonsecaea multimorphosa CBS 102226]|uniref:CHY-type domain-containing protein n=1 Tax=Fonsecaea multimorphosa CBS 102226 TaxID=1442371 RepID=A0A0D2JY30_9EURO|nr:uncharacterized protein Z520_08936 [Fonsecaea multimorphosa CBS 102226]KIX95419.1 hypothetical protein Z520_08936 [Fonsecaea multimorphosa CBS 102226]